MVVMTIAKPHSIKLGRFLLIQVVVEVLLVCNGENLLHWSRCFFTGLRFHQILYATAKILQRKRQ